MRETVKLQCQECNRIMRVSASALDPRCKCGSVDWEVVDQFISPRTASRSEQHARYIDCGPASWDDR